MSKVKIQGNASGTGVVTLTAPNTNTDRTITLPDSTGSILMSDGDGSALTNLPAGGVDGIVSTANATAITIDASENVGIGVTPKTTWDGSHTVLQLGARGALINDNGGLTMDANTYYNAGWKYLNTDFATSYESKSGTHKFLVAPSGTADAAISWTTAMTITNDGRGLSQFTAKAWVKYDQINNTVDDSHNVSSVTDTAAGRYQVFFSTSMANTTYTAFVCINDRGSFGDDNFVTDTETTGSFFVRTKHQNAAGTAYAQDFVSSAIVFGD